MKREEKNQLSRKKILESAMKEFGEQGYGLSSINTICNEGGISKGIMYHYYKDRDELYLDCVKEVFDSLTGLLRERAMPEQRGTEEGLERYFDERMAYFRDHPVCQKIFCEAIVSPPRHLRENIEAIKEEFDGLNVDILTSLLRQVRLTRGTTVEEVVEIFRLYQDFASARYQSGRSHDASARYQSGRGHDAESPESYEEICRKSVNVLLYGVIERGDDSYEQRD